MVDVHNKNKPYALSTYKLYIGKATRSGSGGLVTGVDRAVIQPVGYTSSTGFINDIALVHITTAAPTTLAPLPLRPSTSVVPDHSALQFIGWGAPDSGNSLHATRSSEWRGSDTCFGNGQVCYDKASGAVSTPRVAAPAHQSRLAFEAGGWTSACSPRIRPELQETPPKTMAPR